MSIPPFPRFLSVAGLFALAPLFAAEPVKPAEPAVTLSDEEVHGLLERNEIAQWERAVAARASVSRDLERARQRAVAGAPSGATMKGFDSETPEQRKAKADKLVKDLEEKLSVIDKTLEAVREIAVSRVKAASFSVPCPIRALPEAITASAGDLRAAATAAGYKALSLAGVFVPLNGSVAADAGLTDALRAALTTEGDALPVEAAPVFSGASLKVASDKKTGVVVAEVLPAASLGGAIWSVRLVDAATFRVISAGAAFIPSPAAAEAAKNDYYNRDKKPVGYEIAVQDRRNFVARLGAATNNSFGLDGSGAEVALLRVALAGRPVPALNDYAYLAAVLGGPKDDPVSKALWVVRPGADVVNFSLGSRLVGGRNTATVPVGEVFLSPVFPTPVK